MALPQGRGAGTARAVDGGHETVLKNSLILGSSNQWTGFLDNALSLETNGNRFEAKADDGGDPPPVRTHLRSAKWWIRLGRKVPAPVQTETPLPESTETTAESVIALQPDTASAAISRTNRGPQ
jgi:hypothetical protein